jgi:hypothetical protein
MVADHKPDASDAPPDHQIQMHNLLRQIIQLPIVNSHKLLSILIFNKPSNVIRWLFCNLLLHFCSSSYIAS